MKTLMYRSELHGGMRLLDLLAAGGFIGACLLLPATGWRGPLAFWGSIGVARATGRWIPDR